MELNDAIDQIDVALNRLEYVSEQRRKREARRFGINLTEMTVNLKLTKVQEGTAGGGAEVGGIPVGTPATGKLAVNFSEKRSYGSENTITLKLTRNPNGPAQGGGGVDGGGNGFGNDLFNRRQDR